MKKIMVIVLAVGIGFTTMCSPMNTNTGTSSAMRKYSMGKLEGRTVSGLYARYLGISDKTEISKFTKIDFRKNFEDLWKRKTKRFSSPTIRKIGKQLIAEYDKKVTFTNFKDYEKHVNVVVENLKKSIDWKDVGENLDLPLNKSALLKRIALSFNGKDMTAYIMTELMPSSDGNLNVQMLDFLLKNAGKEYIEGIPALYDDKVSFGPYQFTEYALFNSNEETRGASVINQSVGKSQQIPGSVVHLRGDLHHRAAYLFAIYNLGQMIRGLNANEEKVLRTTWSKNKDDLFLYCATAHHNPAAARKAARLWLSSKTKYPFERSCNRRIVVYAEKTRKNLSAF